MCKECKAEFCRCPAFTPGTPCSSASSTPISTSDKQIPELVANKPVQQFHLHVQTPSDEEADREVVAICKSSEQYRVRSHLRRRHRFLMYNALDDIGEITQYKRATKQLSKCAGTPCQTLEYDRQCPHNNNSGKFFKFKNLQLVRKQNTVRQTRQNTDLRTHGTAEEQFAAITATAHADVLREIDNISSDDESVDYSPPEHLPLEPQVSVRDNGQQISDSDETNKSTPEIATDSSLDTSSIEVIQPNEGLTIKLPHNPPQRAPPNSPENPRTNVAVSTPQDFFTEDEDTEDDDVPPTTTTVTPEVKGRQETLSPTQQVSQTVRSAIEVTAKDFEPSEQRIVDKCGEVDSQLSNHRDWQQPNPRLRQDICDLLPILYQSGFNTEGFPNLEDYLYQTVGTLPCQSLLRLALDSVFEEFPEISAIQTKVYRMLKCHLSVINHPSITQFDDISLSNHDFDRVVGPDFHNVSGAESRPDLSLQTDLNDTYYSVFSQAQRQVYRVTERSLSKLRKDRANSCPDIVQQLHRDTDRLVNSKWKNYQFYKTSLPRPVQVQK